MRRRSGFTLTELLVVIAILLVLSTLAFAVFGTGKSSDKMRSGARAAQSAFLGAKDRALHAKYFRGVRLAHDQTNSNIVNGFVYIWAVTVDPNNPGVLSYPPGSFQMERIETAPHIGPPTAADTPASADILILRGFDGTEIAPGGSSPYVDWAQKQQFFASPGKIRIPSGSGGQWYSFFVNATGAYALQQGNECLQLSTSYPQGTSAPYPANDVAYSQLPAGANGSCDIQLGNDILPFHQPITLPAGCVIDLYWSQIPATWYTTPSPASVPVNSIPAGASNCAPDPANPGNVFIRYYTSQMDVMFSPRGNVSGTIAAMGAMFFMIRDLRDVTNGLNPSNLNFTNKQLIPQGDAFLLAVFPQTGLVQTYELDMTDANGDLIADNILNFAQRGMSAGK